MSKEINVIPLIKQQRTLSQIRQAAKKALKVWTRKDPPNMSHREVELMIAQLPEHPMADISIKYVGRKSGDTAVTSNPDDDCYKISETYQFFKSGLIERFLKGFCYEKDDHNPRGTVVQSAREEVK